MNTRDIAAKYSIDLKKLETFVLGSKLTFKSTMFSGIEVNEDPDYVYEVYQDYLNKSAAEELAKKKKEEEKQRKEAQQIEEARIQARKLEESIRSTIITTTPILPDYKIIEYCGIVSAESNIGTGLISELSMAWADSLGGQSNAFNTKLSTAKEMAEKGLVFKAVTKGANAVIGVDFDILTLSNNAIVVSANGTAVKVERIQ